MTYLDRRACKQDMEERRKKELGSDNNLRDLINTSLTYSLLVWSCRSGMPKQHGVHGMWKLLC